LSEIKQLSDGKVRIDIDDFGGYSARRPPYTKIALNEFPVMDNYFMDRVNDMLIKRGGFLRFITNLPHSGKAIVSVFEYVTSAGVSYLITKSDNTTSGKLSYTVIVNPGSGIDFTALTWTDISTAENTGRQNFVVFKNRLYISNRNNGASVNKIWDATTGFQDVGCPPCDNTNIVFGSNGTGSLSLGKYYYICTYLYDDYQESGAFVYWDDDANTSTVDYYPSKSTTASGESIVLTIPVINNIKGIKVYRSLPNDSTMFYYVTTIKRDFTIGTEQFEDKVADINLGNAINPVLLLDLKKPFISKYQTVHKDRLVSANLAEDLYTAFGSSEISLATSGTGGNLDNNAIYKYRFYKGWIINNGSLSPQIVLSPYVEKQITSGGSSGTTASNTITLSRNGWYGLIFAQRTSGGGSDFKWINRQWGLGQKVLSSPFTDTVADGSRVDEFQNLFIAEGLTNYRSYVAFSDPSRPDLFSNLQLDEQGNVVPNANVFKIGQDDGQAITGIFSEYNRVVVFKERSIHTISTSAQSKEFWVSNVLHKKIGATDNCVLQLPNSEYFFAKIDDGNSVKGSIKFYHWNGQGIPIEVSSKIDTLLNNTATFQIYDMTYDDKKDWVYVNILNNATEYTLIYDMSIRDEKNHGMWYVWYNDYTYQLGNRGMCKLKDFGVVFGTAGGSIATVSDSQVKDKIVVAGSDEQQTIRTYLQSKTFDFKDQDFDLRKFRVTVEVGSASSLVISYIHKIDDVSEVVPYATLPTIGAGITIRVMTGLKGNCARYYFRLRTGSDTPHKILEMSLDLIRRHYQAGGK